MIRVIPSRSFIALHFLVSEIANVLPEGVYCFFYKNYIRYYNVYCYYCGAFVEKHVYTKIGSCVSEFSYMAIYVPIVMYGLLFYKNYIVY